MRIAIVTEGYFPEVSGVTVSLHKRLEVLSRLGHQVRVYAPDYSFLAHRYPDYREYLGEVLAGIEIVPFPSQKFYTDYSMDPKAFSVRRVEDDMQAWGAEAVHVECADRIALGFLGRVGVGLGRRRGIPATAIFQTNYVEYLNDYKNDVPWARLPGIVAFMRRFAVWVYNGYDVTMVTTPHMQEKLARWGVRNLRLDQFIGVDEKTFRPVERRTDGPLTLTYIGRFTADKQTDILMQALSQVAKEVAGCRFVLVGDGMDREKIEAWAKGYPGTLLPGRVPYADLPPYYQNSDIFVTASTREVRPLTIQEAMACGVPVVAPAAGGILDQVQDGVNGLLVAPYDAPALAEALLRLIRDPGLRRQLGRNGREHIGAIGTWEYAARAMLKIWEELAERKNK